jgi:signal transduction histidine kinase
MLMPASPDSRSPTTAFTVLVSLTAGLLVWLVLTSFGLARVQQQATTRLQREIAVLIAEEVARAAGAADPSATSTDVLAGVLAAEPRLARLADSTGLLVSIVPHRARRALTSSAPGYTVRPVVLVSSDALDSDVPPVWDVQVLLSTTRGSPAMAPFAPQFVLSLLFALLSLTIGLAVVMLFRLRREQAFTRQRSTFTSAVSHEMRTPLAQILLFGETLQLGRTRTEADRALATGAIVQEARRLMRLVDNVLRFSRLEQGPAALRQDVVAVDELVRETTRQFAPLAESSGVTLDVRASTTIEAMADADALRQVLLNLLDNAVKYGPPAQRVMTGVEQAADAVIISVEDEGPGIQTADRERIWLPFERASHPLLSRSGSGLGLTIVRELVEAMGGRVTCESIRPDGRGARFTVRLPLAKPRSLLRSAA